MSYPVTVEWQEHREPIVVACPADLSQLLDRIASEAEPNYPPLAMIGNEGGILCIGLGASVGTLNHIPPSNDPPYRICLGDSDAEGVIDFYLAGHHTQFPMRDTIPSEMARSAALEYAETGKLSASVAWEEA